MRHRNQRGKLERPTGHRLALVRNQVTSLLAHERIETTDAKAKVLRRVADRMITLGKRGTLHARRQALAVIRDRGVTEKVFDQLAVRYAERPGGYTRVLKSRLRVGDAAPLSIVELVDGEAGGAGAQKPAAERKGASAEGGARKAAKAAKAAKPRAARGAKAEKPEKPKPEKRARAQGEKGGAKKGSKRGKTGGAGRTSARSADR